ncbi:hypothetical protein Ddc_14226 [Ditylenchus destructor]|nr:hypothetical protein Ddc_14226 [Ditylenchus destructor]
MGHKLSESEELIDVSEEENDIFPNGESGNDLISNAALHYQIHQLECENEFERNRANSWERRWHCMDREFDNYQEFVQQILTEEQNGLLAQYVHGQRNSPVQEVPQDPNFAPHVEEVDTVSPQYEQLEPLSEGIPYIGSFIRNNTSNGHNGSMDDAPSCSSAQDHHSPKSNDENDKKMYDKTSD